MIKIDWFSDLEILKIPQQIYRETYQQNLKTGSKLVSTEKQEHPIQSEPQKSSNLNNTHPNIEQTQTEKEKLNVEAIKIMMTKNKTTLPSLRTQDWKTVNVEMEKINELLTYILMNNIRELNEMNYARAKLVGRKTKLTLMNSSNHPNPGWEIRLETQIGKL